MLSNLDELMKNERKIQKDIDNANQKVEKLIKDTIDRAIIEAQEIDQKANLTIEDLIAKKEEKIQLIESKLSNVVKADNEKIIKEMQEKISKLIDQIYKEAIE